MKAKKHTQKLLTLMIAFVIGSSLVACGGKSKKEAPQTGSFITTYTVMDAQGRNTGTLTLDPSGTAELRDTKGNVIGSFTSKVSPAAPAEKTEAEQGEKEEAK
jgi:hypothetical protein